MQCNAMESNVFMYVFICVRVYVFMYVCMYVCVYVCMYVCNVLMYVCMYVCMHACMYCFLQNKLKTSAFLISKSKSVFQLIAWILSFNFELGFSAVANINRFGLVVVDFENSSVPRFN